MMSFTSVPYRITARAIAFFMILTSALSLAHAQNYPSRPIHLIVPYAAGGSIDIVTRMYGEQLAAKLGQPVIVENRPGAAGNVGSGDVAKSAPDGYTLLIATNTMTQNLTFGPFPSFDLLTSFEPVSQLVRAPLIVATNTKTPYQNAQDMIAFAQTHPGKLSMSSGQLDAYVELLKKRAKIDILHIPYKGGGPAIIDAMEGYVDTVLAVYPALEPQLHSGRLKALVVTSDKRIGVLPDVPTFGDVNVDYKFSFWYGVLAPAKTPPEITSRLVQATQEILNLNSPFAAKLVAMGMEPEPNLPADFRAQMDTESALWRDLGKTMPQLIQKP